MSSGATGETVTSMSYATAIAYFEQLPEGFASFPDCLALGSLLRGRERGAVESLEGLPACLLPLLEHVERDAEWVPEVVNVASLLAIRDARFGEGKAEEEAFLSWLGRLNRDLLGGPSPDHAFLVADVADVLPRLPGFWETFHRGCPLSVVEHSEGHAKLVLTHPPQLFHRINLESHRRTLALSLAMSRPVQPRVTLHAESVGNETQTVFDVTWS